MFSVPVQSFPKDVTRSPIKFLSGERSKQKYGQPVRNNVIITAWLLDEHDFFVDYLCKIIRFYLSV